MISLGSLMGDSVKLGKMDIKLGQVVSNPYAKAFVKEGEEVKTKEGGDHEVFMAQSTLDSIIKAATELKAKVGEQEMDIPAWIQDHITNSENYITQANSGFYKNEDVVNEVDNFDLQLVKNMQQTIKDLETKLKMAKDSREREMIKKNIAVNTDLMKYWAQRSRN